jgi:hypothetical protein
MALGIIRFFWGGTEINIKPGGSLKLGGVVGSHVIYGTSVDTSNKMAESEVKLKAMVLQGQRVSDLYPAGLKQEGQVHCDTGQTFVFPDMFRSGTLDITSGDNSEIDLTFNAGIWMEL